MTEDNDALPVPNDAQLVLSELEARELLDSPTLADDMRRWLLRTLPRTMDGRTRNVIALKLAECGVAEAVPILTKMLDWTETAGYRGTLLYALDELGVKLHPKNLLSLLMTDTYEVQTQAFDMLENTINDMSLSDLRNMLNMVLDSAPTLDTEHREAAAAASEMLVSAFIERSPLHA